MAEWLILVSCSEMRVKSPHATYVTGQLLVTIIDEQIEAKKST